LVGQTFVGQNLVRQALFGQNLVGLALLAIKQCIFQKNVRQWNKNSKIQKAAPQTCSPRR
jgi:hypothetical protein